jgi:hypothetical protein
LQALAPGDVGLNRIVNDRLVVAASALGCLNGVWVFTKKVAINHGVKPTRGV